LTIEPLLFRKGQAPFATGLARYADADPEHPSLDARIILPITSPFFPSVFSAVVDTAAPWCVFRPEIGAVLTRYMGPIQDNALLSTRFGALHGSLYRVPVTLPAENGESLDLEVTAFLSPDWTGPNFIGYQGLLQRIRFAVDPEANLFYFGRI
jgi:hypothetical protein